MRDLKGRLDLCSMNTATLGHQTDIETTIDAVAAKGYGAICPWRKELDGKDIGAIARRIRDAGLAVSGCCRSTYIPALTREQFLANIEDNKTAIDTAAALDAACFVMVVGSLPEGSKDLPAAWQQLEEGTAMMLEHARGAGLRLALEPLHPMYANDRSCLNTLEQALDLAEAVEPDPGDAPMLGVAVDVYHVWWDTALAENLAEAGGERILGYHLCDWLETTRDMLLDRGMMGDGVADLKAIRAAVEGAGYAGPCEVEVFSVEDWWKRDPEEVLDTMVERFRTVC